MRIKNLLRSSFLKLLILVLIFLFGSYMAFSQDITIRGTVVDSVENVPLIGVSVLVKGTTQGTLTDADGKYTIKVSSGVILIFRAIGYQQKQVVVGDKHTINIKLSASNQRLDQLVVVGYGKQKKSSLTAAISTIEGKKIASTPIANLSNGIGGRVSGIIFKQGSGEPGGNASNIYIRGVASTGSTQPLIVVDGIPRSFENLDPNTIESITVLKDAAAVAPYGIAGANGVILVTTKKGKTGLPTLTYNGYVGFQSPTVLPDYVNSFQYASLRNAASKNEGNPPRFSDYNLQKYKNGTEPDIYANSNATKELIERNTLLTSHNIEISGGTEKIKYYTSNSSVIN